MRMVLVSTFLSALTLLTGITVSAANAQGRACHRLWVERNQIYKDYGYCFKTREAIRYFGNRGCRYEYEADIPMSRRDRAHVAGSRRKSGTWAAAEAASGAVSRRAGRAVRAGTRNASCHSGTTCRPR